MPAEFEGRNRIHLDDDEENIEAIIRLPRTLYEEIKTKAESARATCRGFKPPTFILQRTTNKEPKQNGLE